MLCNAQNASTYSYTITPAGNNQYAGGNGTLSYTNNSLQFAGLQVVDIFSASTAANEQPGRYFYRMNYTTSDPNESSYSNQVDVLVLKTAFTLEPVYTLDDLLNDCENDQPTLEASNTIKVKFTVENNPNIVYYNVMRNNIVVGQAQHNQDGTYAIFAGTGVGDDHSQVQLVNTGNQAGEVTHDFGTRRRGLPMANTTWRLCAAWAR